MPRRTIRGFIALLSNWSDSPSRTIGSAALIIAIAGVVSRLLGFLRDRLLASQFGAGDTLDAYYAAFRVPDLLYNLLVMGALSAAFVPVFTELLEDKRRDHAWRLAARVTAWLLAAIGITAAIAFLFAGPVVSIIAPGFDADKRALTEALTRVMLLSPIFLTVSAVLGGVLVSFRRFVAYAFAPVFYNLGIVFGILVLVPISGEQGLAWGVVLGAAFHMAVQLPSVHRSGLRWSHIIDPFRLDRAVMRVIQLMIPRSLGMGVTQLGFLLTTVFASGLSSGSLAVFSLAFNIQSIPLGLFGVAFSLAAFPTLSLAAARRDGEHFYVSIATTARRILFFVVPVSVMLIVFRAQFVRVILGSGQFDWEDTILTFEVLAWFAASLFAQSLIPLFSRGFFAFQDTRTPLYIALTSELVHVALLPLLVPYLGVDALAIAFSAGSVLNAALLYVALRRRAPVWRDREFLSGAARIVVASVLAGAAAQLSKSIFAIVPSPVDTFVEIFTELAIGLAVGGAVYLAASAWLRIEEFSVVRRFVLAKVLRQPEAVASIEGHPEKGEW